MKKSLHTEKQIIGVLKESEAGLGTAELCREHGISAQKFHRWKSKYGGMSVSEAIRCLRLGRYMAIQFGKRKCGHVRSEAPAHRRGKSVTESRLVAQFPAHSELFRANDWPSRKLVWRNQPEAPSQHNAALLGTIDCRQQLILVMASPSGRCFRERHVFSRMHGWQYSIALAGGLVMPRSYSVAAYLCAGWQHIFAANK
jgi:hypothetical protein